MQFSVSPNPYDDNSQEDAFIQVFSLNSDQVEAIEEFNQDKLYFNQRMEKVNPKNTITFEDFDQYYKKFTELEDVNEIEAANYEKPSFFINLSQEKVFSTFENEKVVNVLVPETKIIKGAKNQCCKVEAEENENQDDKDKNNENYKCDKTKESTDTNNNIMDLEKIEKNDDPSIKIELTDENNDLENIIPCNYQNMNDSLNLYNNNENDNDTFTFEKPLSVKFKKLEDVNYPFTQGKGIIHCVKLFDEPNENNVSFTRIQSNESNNSSKSNDKELLSQNFNEEEISLYSEPVSNINEDSLFKFTTKKYFITPNGKRRRIKKNRKYKSDDMRKKIKSRFHKTLKNIINENLKKAGSQKLFDFLPQCFIGNVSKRTNNYCLDLTYKELLLTDFVSEYTKDSYPNKNVDYKKYLKNKEVMKYLENNPEICRKSGFDIIMNKKYKELLNIYFSSAEFEDSIIRLKKENETKEYVLDYVIKAKRYVQFYSNVGKDENKEGN
jgi:hypothetical protein